MLSMFIFYFGPQDETSLDININQYPSQTETEFWRFLASKARSETCAFVLIHVSNLQTLYLRTFYQDAPQAASPKLYMGKKLKKTTIFMYLLQSIDINYCKNN